MCASKAVCIASLLDDLWSCQRQSMVNFPYAMHAQVCSGMLVTTLWSAAMNFDHEPVISGVYEQYYRGMLENNIQILQYLRQYIKVDLFRESASQALKRFDKLTSQDLMDHREREQMDSNTAEYADNPRPFSLDYNLNSLTCIQLRSPRSTTGTSRNNLLPLRRRSSAALIPGNRVRIMT